MQQRVLARTVPPWRVANVDPWANVAPWLADNLRPLAERSEQNGVADRVSDLAAERKTTKEIAKAIGASEEVVQAVKIRRNIPSWTTATTMAGAAVEDPEFTAWREQWLAHRQTARAPEPPIPDDVPFSRDPVVSPESQLADHEHPAGLSLDEAQTIADDFGARLLGASVEKVQVQVVETQAEAFGADSLRRIGRVKGAYDPDSNRIILVAEHLRDRADGETVLRHEAIGHYGLDLLTPADKQTFLEMVDAAADTTRYLRRLKAQEQKRAKPGTDRLVIAEEMFAKLAEQRRSDLGTAWDRLLLWLHGKLKALGLVSGRPNLTVMRVLAADLARAIRAGQERQNGTGRLTDARLAGLVKQYANEEGAPSAAELAEAVRQYRAVEDRYADVLRAHDEQGQPLPTPNGKPSKLNREQWVLVRTDNFKRWFGDWEATDGRDTQAGRDGDFSGRVDGAAVAGTNAAGNQRGDTDAAGRYGFVDPNGEPAVFHHGTADAFTAFDLNHPNRKDRGWLGRGVYTTNDDRLAQSYANIKRGSADPRVMPLFVAVRNPYPAALADKKKLQHANQEQIDQVTARLRAAGYDGAVLRFGDGTLEVAAFNPAAVKSATENAGTYGPSKDIRFAFAGERAATADTHALSRAQEWLADGMTAEDVRRQTGWFRGQDGKWRFEINDRDARLIPGVRDGALNELLDHPRLFEAYPQLVNMQATLDVGAHVDQRSGEYKQGNPNGRHWHERQPSIAVRAPTQQEALTTLLHEIQHGIQYTEGFAVGGNPASSETAALAEDKSAELRAASFQAQQRGDVLEARRLWDDAFKITPYSAYRRLAGEAEARNVQARQHLGTIERENTPPGATQDVPDADVIVVFNGREMHSAPRPENAGAADASTAAKQTQLTGMTPVPAAFPDAFKPDIKDARASARAAYESVRVATEADGFGALTRDGRRVKFSARGFREASSHAADRRVLAATAHLKALFAQAIPLYSEAPRATEQQVSAYHYYAVKADFGAAGNAYVLLVPQDENPNTVSEERVVRCKLRDLLWFFRCPCFVLRLSS
ncbi:LPD23 domain-containing protein [uncultured Thiodictyon sp.]|uniref:LPD23 domain-containing protein n=1 Tax=uncultured Thiodictyon sp. TaxID=1846217 RepID=UPI0025F2BCFC|nr:LPD23 domain-containing protein [uncultured Thiodictyon sp.]